MTTVDEILFKMLPLAQKGYCCSQIMLMLALEAEEKENPDLLRAMSGLCSGLGFSGETCGVLTGGACLIAFFAGKGADNETPHDRLNLLIYELTEWFKEHVGGPCGGITCREILKDSPDMKPDMTLCSKILAETYIQAMTLLMEND